MIEAIFKKLYSKTKVDVFLKKNKCQNIEDIKQQASLNILEKGFDFINELENNNKLESYFFFCCLNVYRNEIKALKIQIDINTLDIAASAEYEEMSIDFDRLEQDYWFKSKVSQQITDVNIGSIQNLATFTEIPYHTLHKTISLTKKIIKDNGEKYIKRTIIRAGTLD